jgi:hypothetical protein
MTIDYPIYADGVIAVKLWAKDASGEQASLFHLAIRYLKPQDTKDKNGNVVNKTTNLMGGETDWFILPSSFGVAVSKSLIEQKVSGLDCFNEDGFQRMINWLVEMEEISGAMCY